MRVGWWAAGALVLVACGTDPSGFAATTPLVAADGGQDAGSDAGALSDGGADAGDAGSDAGFDGGVNSDGGADDGGTDGGVDGGASDGGMDGITSSHTDGSFVAGASSPWPAGDTVYNSGNGLLESPVIAASTDEHQNLWVATREALYLLTPGAQKFRRFDAASGLHLASNPVSYYDCGPTVPFDDSSPWGCRWDVGAATGAGITDLAGGGAGEVFVGYDGQWDDNDRSWDLVDTTRHSGKLDRVRLNDAGSITVQRFDMFSSNTMKYWENRAVQRMIYDHVKHPHELYVGFDHGVDRVLPDAYRDPSPGEWLGTVEHEWVADHIHPRACFHHACINDSDLMLGGWHGLALDGDGNLWVGGRWAAGLVRWQPQALQNSNGPVWIQTWGTLTDKQGDKTGGNPFIFAFGDPYPPNPPVFRPAQEGEPVEISAVTVAPDGKVWFGSAMGYGIASWDGHAFAYYDAIHNAGAQQSDVQDLVALPSGKLAIASPNSGMVIWDPSTGQSVAVRLPGTGTVTRMWLDTMVKPVTLYVSTDGGVAAIRNLP